MGEPMNDIDNVSLDDFEVYIKKDLSELGGLINQDLLHGGGFKRLQSGKLLKCLGEFVLQGVPIEITVQLEPKR
jgi:hypothetical protein